MKEEDLEVVMELIPNGVKFIVKGRINSITVPEFQSRLEHALMNDGNTIVLNMMQVVYLSSIGIRVILKTYKDAAAEGRKFGIEMPSESVKNVLGITMLDKMLIM